MENRYSSQNFADKWLKFWMSGITDEEVYTCIQTKACYSLIKW
jgi:hypothetical protein